MFIVSATVYQSKSSQSQRSTNSGTDGSTPARITIHTLTNVCVAMPLSQDTRRRKLESLQDREAMKGRRARLQAMLLHKLSAKYGKK